MNGFEGQLPGDIELAFRRRLGEVNPLICLVDVAVRDFDAQVASARIPDGALRERLSRYGQGTLYVSHDDLPSARRFVHLSHIAYIYSRAESLLHDLRHHPQTYRLRDKESNEGDPLRRTLYLLLRAEGGDPPKAVTDDGLSHLIGPALFRLLDYYRLVRNAELHGGGDRSAPTTLSTADTNSIVATFHLSPSAPGMIESADALLYSRAWQATARLLCARIARPAALPSLLRQRFGRLAPARRRAAALNLLKRGFLLDDSGAAALLSQLGWLA